MLFRPVFISMLLLLFYSGILAQEADQSGKFNIGFEGGLQFTNLNHYGTVFTPKTKTGFTAGIFGGYNFSKNLKIQLGLKYDRRNFELYSYYGLADSKGNSYYLYQVDYGIKYLTIPLNMFYTAGSDKFKIYVKGGLYFSLLLDVGRKGIENYYIDGEGDADISGTILHYGKNEFIHDGTSKGIAIVDISTENSQPDDISYIENNFKPVDFGLDISLGFLYQPSPSFGIIIGPGFCYSFPKAFDKENDDSKWKQITQVNLGIIYTYSRKNK